MLRLCAVHELLSLVIHACFYVVCLFVCSQDDVLAATLAIFEHDHTLRQRPHYREFLFHTATLKEVVPHANPELTQAMMLLYRLKFVKESVLHPAVDEPGVTTLNSMIAFTSNEICCKVRRPVLFSNY